jgi:hypothetical protein
MNSLFAKPPKPSGEALALQRAAQASETQRTKALDAQQAGRDRASASGRRGRNLLSFAGDFKGVPGTGRAETLGGGGTAT